MKTKKYILLFMLNSFIWFLLYFLTEVITPAAPNPEGIWDLNMNGFVLALFMLYGIHLIPFYLLCIKNIKTDIIKFFLLNITCIIIFHPFIWIDILTIGMNTLSTVLSSLTIYFYVSLMHTFIFFVCFFIKKIYYKLRVTP